MAKFINVAGVEFKTEGKRGAPDAAETVLAELDDAFSRLSGYGLDLVVFSEGVEAIGQTMETAESVEQPGPFLQKYCQFAASEKCHLAASLKIRRLGHVYNSLAFIGTEGQILGVYDKANLTYRGVEQGMIPGNEAVVVDTPIGKLGGVICFDLNFEWLRHQYRQLKPDILCFASMYHGGFKQTLWACECQAFFVSALPFHGSAILDPHGQPLAVTDCYTSIARSRINLDRVMVHLDLNRVKFADIERQYKGEVVIDIPPNIGTALIYSLSDSRTAMDVVNEFELELLDDYFARSLALNEGARTR